MIVGGGGEHKQTRDHPRTTLRLRKSFTKLQKHIEDYYGNVALAIIKEFFFVPKWGAGEF